MSLSDKIFEPEQSTKKVLDIEDVKEFIRLILKDCCTLCEDDIKELAGAELIEEDRE